MDAQEYLNYMFYLILIMIGFFAGYLQNTLQRVKVKRRLLKKPLGLMRVYKKGKFIDVAEINFDEAIYRYGKDKAFDPQKTNPFCVYRENEVPVIHYDEVDTKPLILERTLTKEAEKYFKDPASMMSAFLHFEAGIRKEYMDRMVKLTNQIQTRFQLMQYISIGLLLVVGYLVYSIGGKIDGIDTVVKGFQAPIADIAKYVNIKVV